MLCVLCLLEFIIKMLKSNFVLKSKLIENTPYVFYKCIKDLIVKIHPLLCFFIFFYFNFFTELSPSLTFLNIFYTRMYVTLRKKRSVSTSVSLQLS